MFEANESKLDRTIRVIIGLALLLIFFVNPDSSSRWMALIGLLPLITGIVGICPIYAMYGETTRHFFGK